MKEKNKNKGFTLIELIVVIAIMAVLTGAFAMSLTLISKQRVSNAASSTKQMLQLAQTYTKSKAVCFVKIVGTSDGGANLYIYTRDSASPAGTEKLGNGPSEINKRITTTIVYDDVDNTEVTITSGMEVKIEFDRTTGGFAAVDVPGKDGVTAHPVEIKFSNGTRETTLKLATYTGVVTYAGLN